MSYAVRYEKITKRNDSVTVGINGDVSQSFVERPAHQNVGVSDKTTNNPCGYPEDVLDGLDDMGTAILNSDEFDAVYAIG